MEVRFRVAAEGTAFHDRPPSVDPRVTPRDPTAQNSDFPAAATPLKFSLVPDSAGVQEFPSSVRRMVPPSPTAIPGPSGLTTSAISALDVPECRTVQVLPPSSEAKIRPSSPMA